MRARDLGDGGVEFGHRDAGLRLCGRPGARQRIGAASNEEGVHVLAAAGQMRLGERVLHDDIGADERGGILAHVDAVGEMVKCQDARVGAELGGDVVDADAVVGALGGAAGAEGGGGESRGYECANYQRGGGERCPDR